MSFRGSKYTWWFGEIVRGVLSRRTRWDYDAPGAFAVWGGELDHERGKGTKDAKKEGGARSLSSLERGNKDELAWLHSSYRLGQLYHERSQILKLRAARRAQSCSVKRTW